MRSSNNDINVANGTTRTAGTADTTTHKTYESANNSNSAKHNSNATMIHMKPPRNIATDNNSSIQYRNSSAVRPQTSNHANTSGAFNFYH